MAATKHERDLSFAYSYSVLLNGMGIKKNLVNIQSCPIPLKNPD
jgi:hypothetical protein